MEGHDESLMESTASSSIAGCIENSRLGYGDKQEGEYYNDNGDGQGGSNDSEHFTSKDKGNSDDVSEQSNNSYYVSDNEQSKCIEDDGDDEGVEGDSNDVGHNEQNEDSTEDDDDVSDNEQSKGVEGDSNDVSEGSIEDDDVSDNEQRNGIEGDSDDVGEQRKGIEDDSDDSDNEQFEIMEDDVCRSSISGSALYLGAPLSKEASWLACNYFSVTNHLSKCATSKLLELVSIHCSDINQCAKTPYQLWKQFMCEYDYTIQKYCSLCMQNLEGLNKCSEQHCRVNKAQTCYFAVLPFERHLRIIYSGKQACKF